MNALACKSLRSDFQNARGQSCEASWNSLAVLGYPRFHKGIKQTAKWEKRFNCKLSNNSDLETIQTMGNAKLYVAFYQPRYGNYQHWALYLETDKDDFIFEVSGSHPNFTRNVTRTDPRNSQSFLRMIFMDTVSLNDVPAVQNAASKTKVDNETLEWDCQEYVLDILSTLEEECIVGEDERPYKKAKAELKKRGPIV